MPERETSAEIDEAAAAWAMRIDEAVLSGHEQALFEEWLEGDVRRLGAYARAKAVLVHMKRAKALGPDFAPEAFVEDPGADAGAFPVDQGVRTPLITRRRMLVGASAVAAAGAMAVIIPGRPASALTYETGRGETRLLPLGDGSTVTLNTSSKIIVRTDGRTAELLHGEALFKVASPRHSPFMVQAGGLAIRAEKADFVICRIDERPLEVKVCEGAIQLRGNNGEGPRLIEANRQAVLAPDGRIIEQLVTPSALERGLAWQEGMLSFEDTPLSQAAAEFARYSDPAIEIADPAVAAETITGVYSANNPEGFAEAVALGLNLHIQTTPGGIRLSR
jgi:transmembrane sensor